MVRKFPRRTALIKSLVTNEEKIKAERLAAAEGISVSDYLRRCVITAPEPSRQAA